MFIKLEVTQSAIDSMKRAHFQAHGCYLTDATIRDILNNVAVNVNVEELLVNAVKAHVVDYNRHKSTGHKPILLQVYCNGECIFSTKAFKTLYKQGDDEYFIRRDRGKYYKVDRSADGKFSYTLTVSSKDEIPFNFRQAKANLTWFKNHKPDSYKYIIENC